ncbi:hypothetical protein [Paludibacterium denitrificans]|uniref:Uncharacterized protein n=1 Tax=Paludibacterium denitrificans TaxID=2675226 RepID=A0A844GH16_9NEIS|nr:hypothetical protein [Paludibacterium denitrificans]MTD34177.1 hypothetical protein [Paludibacterium denitrificans]MTD34243.1 hypothetical protein [Paludibacterium denitrificans]
MSKLWIITVLVVTASCQASAMKHAPMQSDPHYLEWHLENSAGFLGPSGN